jgi:non-heme chloroperoxidase
VSVQPIQLGNFQGLHAPGIADRPPVLCVHGAFSCPEQLRPLLEAFSGAGIPSYAFPLRGHGPGDRVDGARIADYVMDVLAMIRQLGAPPILLGHSMGGLVVLKVAETGNCRGAILVAAAPPVPVRPTMASVGVFAKLLPRIVLGATIAPPREDLRRISLRQVEPAMQQRILDTFVPESGAALRDTMLGAMSVDPLKIRVPLLSLIGARDRLIPAGQMRSAARRYGATVREYAEGGHSLFVEPQGEQVKRDMIDWVLRLDQG